MPHVRRGRLWQPEPLAFAAMPLRFGYV